MFIGHFAPALVAAAIAPRRPRLALYFIAAQLVDWVFFALLLFGVERMRIVPGITEMVPFDLYHVPFTHSLLGSAVFALGFGLLVWVSTRERLTGLLAGLVAFSHWLLDLLVHRPDLTLVGGEARLGLGLWNHPAVAIPLELGITVIAFAFFLWRTRGPALPAIVLAVVLLALQAVNWFGPEPEAVTPALSYTAFGAFALPTLVAWWLGKTRRSKAAVGLARSNRAV